MAIRYTVNESEIAKELKYKIGGTDIEIVIDDETNKTSEGKKEEETEEEEDE